CPLYKLGWLSALWRNYGDVFCCRPPVSCGRLARDVFVPRASPYKTTLSIDEKAILQRAARQYTSSYFSVVRAKVILMAARGLRNDQIAAQVSLPRQIVSKWRKRFFEERLAGLENLPRSGRPPSFSP